MRSDHRRDTFAIYLVIFLSTCVFAIFNDQKVFKVPDLGNVAIIIGFLLPVILEVAVMTPVDTSNKIRCFFGSVTEAERALLQIVGPKVYISLYKPLVDAMFYGSKYDFSSYHKLQGVSESVQQTISQSIITIVSNYGETRKLFESDILPPYHTLIKRTQLLYMSVITPLLLATTGYWSVVLNMAFAVLNIEFYKVALYEFKVTDL